MYTARGRMKRGDTLFVAGRWIKIGLTFQKILTAEFNSQLRAKCGRMLPSVLIIMARPKNVSK